MLFFKLLKSIYPALLILLALLFAGVSGYMWLEGYSLGEAFYMTIITVSTVGFSEVHTLSAGGRLFTIALIISSFGTFAYAISSLTNYWMGGRYRKVILDHRLQKMVEKLEDHVIVCGFGRVGNQVVNDLISYGKNFVIIERNAEIVKLHGGNLNLVHVEGDATRDEILEDAGVYRAKSLITTLPDDADNIYVILAAKELNPKLKIISRASRKASLQKMKFAGATNVIMPDLVGGAHMASLVISPDIMEFLDQVSISGSQDHQTLLEVEAGLNEWKVKNIGEMRELLGSYTLVGMKSNGGQIVVNPADGDLLLPDAKLFLLGRADEKESIRKLILQ